MKIYTHTLWQKQIFLSVLREFYSLIFHFNVKNTKLNLYVCVLFPVFILVLITCLYIL